MSVGRGPVRFRDFAPPYEPTKITTLTNSGTVIAGTATHHIVVEYFTAQNVGSVDVTLAMREGTVDFNSNLVPYTAGQNFFAWGAPSPGREWELPAGTPFVLNFSTAGSVITNTRYWLRGTA